MTLSKTSVTDLVKATPAELNDKLKKGLTTIDAKLKKLGVAAQAEPFKANSNFKYNELDGNTVNIQSCIDIGYLVKALSKMKRLRLEYDDTCTELELKTTAILLWVGVPVDSWIHDLTIRIKLVANATQIAELQKAKTELTAFLSTEDRLVATLTKVKDLL